MLPKQAIDVYLPDRAPTEASIQDPKLMLPKYAPHDIIAEQTPSEKFNSRQVTKKFISGGPL